MQLISAKFQVSPLCNYQNFELVLHTAERDMDGEYIIIKPKTKIQNTDEMKEMHWYSPCFSYYKKERRADRSCIFTYLLEGIESVPNWRIITKKGSPADWSSSTTVTMAWSDVFYSGIACDIWLVDESFTSISNVISDVITPDVHIFRENFESYTGLECTQIGDDGGDNYCTFADGVYFPIVKDQTFLPFTHCSAILQDDTNISVNSCVACAVSSGLELINYKMTGSVKVYSTGFIYGAATEDSGNGRYNINDREKLIDLAGMYFNDAKAACVNYGCPPVEAIPYNRYDGQYTWSPNDSFPCIQFEQEYTDPVTKKTIFLKRVNARMIYNTMRNTAQGRDRLINIFEITADKESIKACIKSQNNAVIVLSKKIIEYDNNGIAAATPQQNANHAMLIIGWITIGGVFHWVCHNSWGKQEGDNGKIYLPFEHSSIGAYYQLSGFIKGRPHNWSWYTIIGQGKESYRRVNLGQANEIKCAMLSAREWTDFCGRINEFRVYKGIGKYVFTKPVMGKTFTALHFNEALDAIRPISGETLPTAKASNNPVTAEDLFLVRDILNRIT